MHPNPKLNDVRACVVVVRGGKMKKKFNVQELFLAVMFSHYQKLVKLGNGLVRQLVHTNYPYTPWEFFFFF